MLSGAGGAGAPPPAAFPFKEPGGAAAALSRFHCTFSFLGRMRPGWSGPLTVNVRRISMCGVHGGPVRCHIRNANGYERDMRNQIYACAQARISGELSLLAYSRIKLHVLPSDAYTENCPCGSEGGSPVSGSPSCHPSLSDVWLGGRPSPDQPQKLIPDSPRPPFM